MDVVRHAMNKNAPKKNKQNHVQTFSNFHNQQRLRDSVSENSTFPARQSVPFSQFIRCNLEGKNVAVKSNKEGSCGRSYHQYIWENLDSWNWALIQVERKKNDAWINKSLKGNQCIF